MGYIGDKLEMKAYQEAGEQVPSDNETFGAANESDRQDRISKDRAAGVSEKEIKQKHG